MSRSASPRESSFQSHRHLSLGNLSKCPKCEYCGFHDYLSKMIDQEDNCPMCDAKISSSQLEVIKPEDQTAYLRTISFGNIDEVENTGN